MAAVLTTILAFTSAKTKHHHNKLYDNRGDEPSIGLTHIDARAITPSATPKPNKTPLASY